MSVVQKSHRNRVFGPHPRRDDRRGGQEVRIAGNARWNVIYRVPLRRDPALCSQGRQLDVVFVGLPGFLSKLTAAKS